LKLDVFANSVLDGNRAKLEDQRRCAYLDHGICCGIWFGYINWRYAWISFRSRLLVPKSDL